MCGPRVHESVDFRYIKRQKGNIRHKRVWVEKSGCVEVGLLWFTSGVNAARRLCRGLGAAYSFFDLELAPEFKSVLPDSAAMATA